MSRLFRFFGTVLVVALVGSACGGSDSTSASTTTASTTTVASTTSEAASSTTSAELADDGVAAEEADGIGDDEIIDFALSATGLQLTDPERSCIKDSELIDVEALRSGDEQSGDLLLLATFGCAPETIARASSAGMVVDGVDIEGIECAMTEAIRSIGSLSEEDALAAVNAPAFPESARPEALAQGVSVCGLTEDQVNAVLDS